jgi:hypothetical protein
LFAKAVTGLPFVREFLHHWHSRLNAGLPPHFSHVQL